MPKSRRVHFDTKTSCFDNDFAVAIATMQVDLDLHQTFYARPVGNSFTIFSDRHYPQSACFCKVRPMPKIMVVQFFDMVS